VAGNELRVGDAGVIIMAGRPSIASCMSRTRVSLRQGREDVLRPGGYQVTPHARGRDARLLDGRDMIGRRRYSRIRGGNAARRGHKRIDHSGVLLFAACDLSKQMSNYQEDPRLEYKGY
jgi:hypothetical protein